MQDLSSPTRRQLYIGESKGAVLCGMFLKIRQQCEDMTVILTLHVNIEQTLPTDFEINYLFAV